MWKYVLGDYMTYTHISNKSWDIFSWNLKGVLCLELYLLC